MENEAVKDAVIGKSPLALAYIIPFVVPQLDTSSCHNFPSIIVCEVLIELVTIVLLISLIDNITDWEGKIEADITGWNKSFTGL